MSNNAIPYEVELHRRLVERNSVASSDLYKYVVDESDILKSTKYKYYSIDEDDVYDKLVDCIIKLIENPEKYDPAKRTLLGFFQMDLEGDLKNLLEKQKRTEKKVGKVVELYPKDGNSTSDNSTPETEVIQQEAQEVLEGTLKRLFPNSSDYIVASLVLANERATAAYVDILDIKHLDAESQQTEVKRAKDRIKKVLERSPLKKIIESYQNG